ncbi:MAG: class IV adenylate cyclase [Phycisphaerae bacterium]
MAVEIEAKMKVETHDDVRAKLHEHAAEHVGTYREVNRIFDTEDRSLLAGDQGLRLRARHDADGNAAFTLTYKGPRRHSKLKSREEIEMGVTDIDAATSLLEALGYGLVLSFEKRRDTFSLGGCLVELDELPHLGTYVEVEGPDEASVLQLREQLGLSDHAIVKASYPAMLLSHMQEEGITQNDVSFA